MAAIQYACQDSIYELDSDVSADPKRIYTFPGGGSIKSITRTHNNKLFILVRSGPAADDFRSIYELDLSKSQNQESFIYDHPHPLINLEVRHKNDMPYLYFSAKKDSGYGSKLAIYYFEPFIYVSPRIYCEGDDYVLPLPSPCGEGEVDFGWRGNFAFDGIGNLYLSTGNVAPAGLFRLHGASYTEVTGTTPVRIHIKTDGGIWGIACANEKKIYFHRSSEIYRLNIDGTTTEKLVTDIGDDQYASIGDIACNPSLSYYHLPTWKYLIGFFKLLFDLFKKWTRRAR